MVEKNSRVGEVCYGSAASPRGQRSSVLMLFQTGSCAGMSVEYREGVHSKRFLGLQQFHFKYEKNGAKMHPFGFLLRTSVEGCGRDVFLWIC